MWSRLRTRVSLGTVKTQGEEAAEEETELDRILRDMPGSALRLVTPLVFMGSYLRLHGTSWATLLLKDFFEMLREPTTTLYILNEDLRTPPNMMSALSMMVEAKSRERKPRQSVVFTSDVTTGAAVKGNNASASSYSQESPSRASSANLDDELTNGFLEGLPNPMVRQFYETMLNKEATVAHGITRTVTALMRALAESNTATRIPAGISHLLTHFFVPLYTATF